METDKAEKCPEIVGLINQIQSKIREIGDIKNSLYQRVDKLDAQNKMEKASIEKGTETKSPDCLQDELGVILTDLSFMYNELERINYRFIQSIG